MDAFPRKKRRLLVQFLDRNGVTQTGFTHNLSLTGLFVIPQVLPETRAPLNLMLHLPSGRILHLTGVVARHGPPPGEAGRLAQSVGFGFALAGYFEEYTQFVIGLP